MIPPPAMTSPLRLLLLDLDDTLIDSSGLLAPAAHAEAVREMMAAGLPGEFEQLLAARLRIARELGPESIAHAHVARVGGLAPERAAAIAEIGRRAYYDRDPGPIALPEGVAELLGELGRRLPLVLVTSGVRRTQEAKVVQLDLRAVERVVYCPAGGWETKLGAFEQLQRERGLEAHEVASVGDRPDGEISAGNRLGFWTVQVLAGEQAGRAALPEDLPHLKIGGPLQIGAAVAQVERWLREGRRPPDLPRPGPRL